jgi:hypothetical protein
VRESVCGREEGRTFGTAKIQNLKFCQVATDCHKRGKRRKGKKTVSSLRERERVEG